MPFGPSAAVHAFNRVFGRLSDALSVHFFIKDHKAFHQAPPVVSRWGPTAVGLVLIPVPLAAPAGAASLRACR